MTSDNQLFLFIRKCLQNFNIAALAEATDIPAPWLYWLKTHTICKTNNYSAPRLEKLYQFFTGLQLVNMEKAEKAYEKNKKHLIAYSIKEK